MRRTALEMVHELARRDPRIVFIGSDLGAGTLQAFRDEMPDRFFMEGVSEANVIGMAAGLAMEGNIVYVNTIASFLTRRCFEQVALDLCLARLPVRLIGNGGGLVYAPLGPTHETVEDLAILRALPNMTVLAPADAGEMQRLMPCTVDHPGPVYIRLGKGGDPLVTDPAHPFVIGRAYPMRQGADALVVSTGVCLGLALRAADHLAEEGCSCGVLHVPTIKPFDADGLVRAAGDAAVVVTVEEHSIVGGLGGAVAEILCEADFAGAKRMRRIGLADTFPEGYGSQAALMARHGIDVPAIVDAVRALSS